MLAVCAGQILLHNMLDSSCPAAVSVIVRFCAGQSGVESEGHVRVMDLKFQEAALRALDIGLTAAAVSGGGCRAGARRRRRDPSPRRSRSRHHRRSASSHRDRRRTERRGRSKSRSPRARSGRSRRRSPNRRLATPARGRGSEDAALRTGSRPVVPLPSRLPPPPPPPVHTSLRGGTPVVPGLTIQLTPGGAVPLTVTPDSAAGRAAQEQPASESARYQSTGFVFLRCAGRCNTRA